MSGDRTQQRQPDADGLGVRAPGDELRPVTALFADVVGSTSLGERLALPEVKAVIGECVTRMTEVVEVFGGRVGAYMGDGIAAFFGLDATREDDAERGARAALEIRKVIAQYATEVREAWGISDFDVRIGVNAGRVAIGDVGASDPQQLALGDPINVAARLQSAATPGTIVVGEPITRSASGRFVFRALGEIQVRGRLESVLAFELEDEGETTTRARSNPFVGRTTEIGSLEGMLRDLEAGRGQLCVLIGEAGIGKTRMLAEIRRRTPSDVHWLEGSCDPIDNRLPYEPFVQAMRGWLGTDARSAAIETRVRLASRLKDLFGEESDDRLAYLSRLLGVGVGRRLGQRLEGLPPDVLTSGLINAYRDWLIALAMKSPIVLAVDNFGLASTSTAEMGVALFEAVQQAPVLMVVTMRPERSEAAWRLRARALGELTHRCREVSLLPLDANEADVLVGELDTDGLLDEKLRGVVVDRSEGNPLYIEELFAAVTSGPTDGTSSEALPAQLETLLLARIGQLPAEAKALLQAAAVLGRRFPYEVLASMNVVEDVAGAFAPLLQADVLREHGRRPPGYIFRHGLIREAALSTLTPSRLRALHTAAARALRGWAEFDEERDADVLARHYVATGDWAAAVECLEQLGDRLAAVYRYDEACDVLRRCLSGLGQLKDEDSKSRIGRKLAELLGARGQVDLAIEVLDEAAACTPHGRHKLEMTLLKARWLGDVGRFAEAEELAECCLQDVEASTTMRSEALILQGRLALHQLDTERAARLIDRLGDQSALPEELQYDAAILSIGSTAIDGNFEDAEICGLRAQAIADKLGRMTSQLTARMYVALTSALRGALDEGRILMTYVYRRWREIGFVTGQLETALNLQYVLHSAGAISEGVRVGEQAMELDPGPMWRGLLSANLADLTLEQGKFDDAERLAGVTLDLNQDLGSWPRVTAHVVIAMCASYRGLVGTAQEHLNAAKLEAFEANYPRERILVLVALANEARVRKEFRQALEYVAAARDLLSTRIEKPLAVIVERTYGCVLAENEAANARDVLLRAVDSARRIGMPLEHARALVSLSRIDKSRSAVLLGEAQTIFEECGSNLGLIELTEMGMGSLASANGV